MGRTTSRGDQTPIESFLPGLLVMAYPQRDVHLNTEQPLRIKMTPAEPGSVA